MSLYNYVDTPNTNLICCICRAPFTHPTTTLTCSHTFCSECILRALSHAPLCPVDRSPLGVGDLRSASPIVRAMVDELLVECPYRFEGCESVKERQMMPLHLKEECCFAEGRVLAEESAGMSQAMEEREVHEDRAGGSSRARSASGNSERPAPPDSHSQPSSSEPTRLTCPHSTYGCAFTCPPSPSSLPSQTNPIQEHLSICPYAPLLPFLSSVTSQLSSLTSQVTSLTTRNAVLTEQNILLKQRVENLESAVGVLKGDVRVLGGVVGPWVRGAQMQMREGGGAMNVNVGIRGAEAQGPSTENMADPTLGVQASEGGGASSSSSAAPERNDDLASYFPSEHPMRHRSTSSADAFPGMPSGRSVVAPLDLGGTLERTLVGLRESVVGVAGNLDSVGRRGEIALANETLRLGEEMMSVRAQMHGLRMQVHGMMMDRNAVVGAGTGVEGSTGANLGMGMGFVPSMHRNSFSTSITKL